MQSEAHSVDKVAVLARLQLSVFSDSLSKVSEIAPLVVLASQHILDEIYVGVVLVVFKALVAQVKCACGAVKQCLSLSVVVALKV